MTSISRVVLESDGIHQHRFGGPPVHRGSIPKPGDSALHLLYTFDTTDPQFPTRMPGVRYLPLYYCFQYNAGDVGYHVLSDDRIRIRYMSTTKVENDFPFEHYPAEFPEHNVSLQPISYDEHKALLLSMAFSDHIIDDEIYLSESDRHFIQQSDYPFTQIGGIQRMWQGVPEVECPFHHKADHVNAWGMQVFAVVWNEPVPGVYRWDDEGLADDSQVIFQICPACHYIHACNRYT